MIKNFKNRTVLLVIIALVVFVGVYFSTRHTDTSKESSEITAIKATQNLPEQVALYKKLINRVGPIEAQEDLLRSGLPFTGQTHLLNHTVGDYLYQKFGPAGLVQCRDYFLSSCYHGFILDAIADGGMPEVAKTFAECIKFGPAVSSQCAHAIGHGFLANVGYKNLVKALQTCDQAAISMPGFPAFNCYDGVFMENIWAVHNGSPSPDRWVKASDKVYPCDDKRIDGKYILACWSNQPSLDFQFYQGDLKKVANVCLQVKNPQYQNMCFDGLARQIHPLTDGLTTKTLGLCSLMPSQKWDDFCVSVNAGASYAVGDRVEPFEICGAIEESGKDDCYNRIFADMNAYRKPGDNFKDQCSKISDADFRAECEKMP
jgi:hypothetical protein